VVLVLLRLNIVLEEHFDLGRHLWPDVFEEQTSDDSNDAESERGQCHGAVMVRQLDLKQERLDLPNSVNVTIDKGTSCGLGNRECQP
jgi:hypothetical protein